jgi:uncharacterized protein YutE (UPF0331/DUF86 family)
MISSYDELIRHFLLLETQYKDDLELLMKFFRQTLQQVCADRIDVSVYHSNVEWQYHLLSQSLKIIDDAFGCLDDIYTLTSRFLSDLEDAKEKRDDLNKHISLYEPFQYFLDVRIQSMFDHHARLLSLFKGNEYEHYIHYAQIISNDDHIHRLQTIVNDERVQNYLHVDLSCSYSWIFDRVRSTFYFSHNPIKCSKPIVIYFQRYFIGLYTISSITLSI